ncbi:MAG: tail fiber protein, partial [Xanthobacteraceae bacterium]|nr:tail fiber protein [Xanthobacteraceae bacterium]
MSAINVPIGFICMFAGDLSDSSIKNEVIAAGWLPCDGTSYTKSQYSDLFAVIGTSHGGSGNNFNVPNMTGRFARGTTGTSNVDPDAGSRVAAAAGGAAGNAVGSLQQSATALPKNPWVLAQDGDHYHAYQHLSTTMHEVWSGSTDSMARWSSTVTIGAAGGHFHTMSGGDPATVPVNVAIYWVIRATSATAAAQTPAGAIAPFGTSAANQSPSGWIYCNGMPQAIASSDPTFAATIGSNFGGDGVTVFNVPDLRGQFVRGTSHGTGRDPNAASRYALL